MASYFGDYEMPFGEHKYEKIRNVPASYLEWLLTKCETADADLKYYVKQEMAFRRARAGYSGQDAPQAAPAVAVDAAIGLEIVKEGRRALALKYHPDICGGNNEKMTLTNATADYLEKRLSLLLGAAA